MQVTEQMRRDLAEDGAIVARGLFTRAQLQRMRDCFEYGLAHPSPMAQRVYPGTEDEHFNDYGNPENGDYYLPVIKELRLGEFVADLWGSEHAWFLGEELFMKSGGKAGRSPWHQDTSYMAGNGPHLTNIWVSFESLPKKNSLEVVRGSHRGPEYDGTDYTDPKNPTKPIWGDENFPRLPDIEAERATDSEKWDVLSWDLEPGDALVFHSGSLHGGAPVTPDCPIRHTIVMRFFGDQIYYRPLPTTAPNFVWDLREYDDRSLTPGEPFRSPYFAQLV